MHIRHQQACLEANTNVYSFILSLLNQYFIIYDFEKLLSTTILFAVFTLFFSSHVLIL
jgi:hypothetical protein